MLSIGCRDWILCMFTGVRAQYRNKTYQCKMCSVIDTWCFMLICFVFRVKVLVLCLWQAMSALTACLTSWSTSLSTTDSALTSSVLVSVSCMKLPLFSVLKMTYLLQWKSGFSTRCTAYCSVFAPLRFLWHSSWHWLPWWGRCCG